MKNIGKHPDGNLGTPKQIRDNHTTRIKLLLIKISKWVSLFGGLL